MLLNFFFTCSRLPQNSLLEKVGNIVNSCFILDEIFHAPKKSFVRSGAV